MTQKPQFKKRGKMYTNKDLLYFLITGRDGTGGLGGQAKSLPRDLGGLPGAGAKHTPETRSMCNILLFLARCCLMSVKGLQKFLAK